MTLYCWSAWYPLESNGELKELIPKCPGIYEIRINREFSRLNGATRIVNIGRAANLKERVWGKKACKFSEDASGAMKWLKEKEDPVFEARWFALSSLEEAKNAEDQRLAEFIAKHWELPPGQSQGPRFVGTDLGCKVLSDPTKNNNYIDLSRKCVG